MNIKNLTKLFAIGAACILSICGCGGAADVNNGGSNGGSSNDQQLEGADWRTWGTIDDYGTLSLDGTDTDVCVCLFADRAELYYDRENQELFKTIEFPEKLSDEEYEKLSIEFIDNTGDDNTDIVFVVGTENTVDRRFSYIYDSDVKDFAYDAFSAYPNPNVVDDSGEEGVVDFTGRYTEPDFGRCLIEISKESEDSYTIVVNWSNSASDESVWAITGATYGESGDELVYTDALYYHRTYDEDGGYEDEDIYDNGTGRFYMTEGGMLGWESDNTEDDGIDGEVMFERLDQ